MKVKKLGVANYRNIKEIILEPSDHLNFITGHNGAGKTSIIESLYYISYGKSFKTERLPSLIQQNQDYFHLRCIVEYDKDNSYDIYIKQFKNKREVYIDNELVKNQIEVAKLIPIQIISPDTVQLLTLGPNERRKFLNWGMFYTFEEFNTLWKDFQRAHQGRNKILQRIKFYSGQNKTIPATLMHDLHHYMAIVIKLSQQLDVLYQEYLNKLLPVLQRILHQLLPELELEVKFYRGWALNEDLQTILETNIEHILESGRVVSGLHRFDLVIKCYGELVQNVLSGGQLKLLSCALKLAQGELFKELNNNQCIYLVDDLAAELDETKQVLFAQQLLKDQNQIFMSYINNKDLNIFSNICHQWNEFAIKKGSIDQQFINGILVKKQNMSVDELIDQTTKSEKELINPTKDESYNSNVEVNIQLHQSLISQNNNHPVIDSSLLPLDKNPELNLIHLDHLKKDSSLIYDNQFPLVVDANLNVLETTFVVIKDDLVKTETSFNHQQNNIISDSNITFNQNDNNRLELPKANLINLKPSTNQLIDELLEESLNNNSTDLDVDNRLDPNDPNSKSDQLDSDQLYQLYLEKSQANLNQYHQTKLYSQNYKSSMDDSDLAITAELEEHHDLINEGADSKIDDDLPYVKVDLDK